MRRLLSFAAVLSVLLLCHTGCRHYVADPPLSNPPATDSVATVANGPQWPGLQPDGSMLLPNQWSLRPVGKQIVLGDFPVNIAIHPSGKWAAILHSGYGEHEITVIQISSGDIVSRASLKETFYGLAFSPDGKRLVCSGAGDEVLHRFDFKNGFLFEHSQLKLRDPKERGIPAGLSFSADGRSIFAANLWGQSIDTVALDSGELKRIALSTNVTWRTNLTVTRSEEEAAITKRAEALLEAATDNYPFPYTTLPDRTRNLLYVSYWAQGGVAVIDLAKQDVVHFWETQEHPNEMLLTRNGKNLFVANANRNTVSILDTATGRVVETLVAELKPGSPPGSTPNSLALTPDEDLLFVANANINAIAVFNVSEIGKSRSLGFIPVGWYPTSVRVAPDGKKLLVTNGKGSVPKANRFGPQPGKTIPADVREYIAGLFHGTLSIINLSKGERFEEQMKQYTAQAYKCMPKPETVVTLPANHPIPAKLGGKSPIKNCIYIIKENRTYDQILGDMPEGRGDPTLCLFPERVTPNHHKLAREFVLLDNFYVESEVSADGHEWTVGAYATDFVEKHWPLSYGHNTHKKYPYPAEGNFAVAAPAGGYIWDRCKEAGVSYFSFGEFVANGATVNEPSSARVRALRGHFDPWFRGFDMDYPDVQRAARFIDQLNRFELEGKMPQLTLLRLSSDHTSGTTEGKLTPTAQVADNDLALGMVVEAVSKSRFWHETAIFVVEDDAQNGPDHVDAHRTIAFVISPYSRKRGVDSTMYSTSSMLRTMELILGLRPMSQFDATAAPMFNSFQPKADFSKYHHAPARADLTERNLRTAWGSDLSKKMDFSKEDAADDIALNEVIWRSVKGAGHPMPSPTRAGFVFAKIEDDDDDD
jgi:DNA-binding beta-propeller fold protein YncE